MLTIRYQHSGFETVKTHREAKALKGMTKGKPFQMTKKKDLFMYNEMMKNKLSLQQYCIANPNC